MVQEFKEVSGHICELVKWHSIQKHEFLKNYLSIWKNQVGNKASFIPSLDIIDLYASWGWCHCEENDKTWPGTALLAAECLEEYEKGRLLFLNTYHGDNNILKLQKQNLIESLKSCNVQNIISTLPIEEAVDKALEVVNLKYPTLWLLDPYGPKQLPWTVVEKICSVEKKYIDKKNRERSRRPEVLISLMTSSLQREINNESLICKSLGINKTKWQELESLAKHGNTREVLVGAYIDCMSKFYEKAPIVFKVRGTSGIIVYTLLLFTDSPAGNYVTKLQKIPEMEKWLEIEWNGNAKEIEAKRKLKPGQKSLFDSF